MAKIAVVSKPVVIVKASDLKFGQMAVITQEGKYGNTGEWQIGEYLLCITNGYVVNLNRNEQESDDLDMIEVRVLDSGESVTLTQE